MPTITVFKFSQEVVIDKLKKLLKIIFENNVIKANADYCLLV